MTSGICAGKHCKNEGILPLRIRYLELVGMFCQSCADTLVHDELAVKEGA